MSAIVLQGDTSGSVTINAPGVAGIQSYTLPSALPTASGQALVATTAGVMSWAAAGLTGITNSATPFITALGSGAATNITGSYNTAIGYNTLNTANSNSGHTAIGALALKSATGNANTAVGFQALRDTTTASGNSALGVNALVQNTTGTQNTAVGDSTLYSNLTGSYSTAIGYQALNANTGGQNTAVGRMAMFTATSASGSTAIGVNALYTATSGSNNVAVGDTAAFALTTGSGNVAVGNGALYTNNTLSNMVAIGNQAMFNSSTTGNYNVAIGYRALFSQDSFGGESNTAIGYQALLSAKGAAGGIAQSNTAVGSNAGQNLTGVGNNNSTLIGAYAGNLITSGTANTIIGANAGSNITTGSKNTIIGTYNGNQGGLNITTSSNYIVLSDGDGNPRGMFNSNGYFEASPSGGFPDGTNLQYHYFSSPVSAGASGDQVLMCRADSASFAGSVFFTRGNRNTVNSTFNSLICRNGNDTGVFAVRDSGNCANTNNSYGAYSDIALKENIVDATPKLDDLLRVQIRKYNLKAKPDEKHIGVIAQELEAIFPGLVETDNEGIKNVKYSIFVPMLIKAVQELTARVIQLETR